MVFSLRPLRSDANLQAERRGWMAMEANLLWRGEPEIATVIVVVGTN